MARSVRTLALVLALSVAGCSVNLLGGREKCWPDSESRAASLWRGILTIEAGRGQLATPEGEVTPLLPGGDIGFRVDTDELVQGDEVVAKGGDDVTLFGGAGADGALKVCGVEEIHSSG